MVVPGGVTFCCFFSGTLRHRRTSRGAQKMGAVQFFWGNDRNLGSQGFWKKILSSPDKKIFLDQSLSFLLLMTETG